MEEAIQILKKIGVKEISKTTKISMSKIEDILEKRFVNLQRVRLVGFLNILEREYKVDLSQLLEEYDENILFDIKAHQELPLTENNEFSSVSSFDFDTQKQKDDLIEQRKKQFISKRRFYISLLVVIVILAGYFTYKSFFESDQKIKSAPVQNEESKIEQESISEEPLNVKDNAIEEQKDSSLQKNESEGIPADVEESTQKLPDVSKTQEISASQIIIKPDKELWIEVINLDNNQKLETITSKPYSIETGNDKLLISFGHGEFELTEGNKIEHFSKSYPMRFLYTPSEGLKHIKYAQYLKLSNKNIQNTQDDTGGQEQ